SVRTIQAAPVSCTIALMTTGTQSRSAREPRGRSSGSRCAHGPPPHGPLPHGPCDHGGPAGCIDGPGMAPCYAGACGRGIRRGRRSGTPAGVGNVAPRLGLEPRTYRFTARRLPRREARSEALREARGTERMNSLDSNVEPRATHGLTPKMLLSAPTFLRLIVEGRLAYAGGST